MCSSTCVRCQCESVPQMSYHEGFKFSNCTRQKHKLDVKQSKQNKFESRATLPRRSSTACPRSRACHPASKNPDNQIDPEAHLQVVLEVRSCADLHVAFCAVATHQNLKLTFQQNPDDSPFARSDHYGSPCVGNCLLDWPCLL